MPEHDFTNMEEAWDSFPVSKAPDPRQIMEATFYAGAMAVLSLISQGRSLKTLNAEIGDWNACYQERFNAARH